MRRLPPGLPGRSAQLSPVSCDAVMSAALKADDLPAGKLVVLGSASPDPVPSVLVVETATVGELFGSSLATAWAPAVLASFGSGTSAITVRVVAPHGAAACQTSLDAGLAGRKTSGAALLNDSRITVSATARSQLLAGQVDSRLLLALAALAGRQADGHRAIREPRPGRQSPASRSSSPTWPRNSPGCPHRCRRLRARRLGRPERGRGPAPPGQGGKPGRPRARPSSGSSSPRLARSVRSAGALAVCLAYAKSGVGARGREQDAPRWPDMLRRKL